jgi:hypothetical protein
MGAISRDDELFWHRLTIFSVSAGMVGVCLTGIGLFRVVTRLGAVQSLGDELMSVDALLFLTSAALSFLSMRGRGRFEHPALMVLVDVSFFLALCLMVAVCGLLTWAIL